MTRYNDGRGVQLGFPLLHLTIYQVLANVRLQFLHIGDACITAILHVAQLLDPDPNGRSLAKEVNTV